MKKNSGILYKIVCSMIFLIGLPLLFLFWAEQTEDIIPYKGLQSSVGGWSLMIIGAILMLWSFFALRVYGHGLPLNAFPPPLLVQKGPYKIMRHPVYFGFGLITVGYFILSGSGSGLWLVTPIYILGVIALILGYERLDLLTRFPEYKNMKTISDIPESSDKKPSTLDKTVSIFYIFSLLMFSYLIKMFLIQDSVILSGTTKFDVFWFIPALILLSTIFIKRKDHLREWLIISSLSLLSLLYITFFFPFLIRYYQNSDLNLYHADSLVLFFTTSIIFYRQFSFKILPLFIIFSILLAYGLQLNMYKCLCILGLLVVAIMTANYKSIWFLLKNKSELIANSWKEWTIGKVRIINHGFYVGFGAFFGILLSGILAGETYAWAILVFSVVVTVISAIWAQVIEGSNKLKRPFGYYGALVGVLFASYTVWLMGINVWIIIGTISVVMPWVQAIGRLRCLVNGCCHGHKTSNENIGIRYFHARSRVCGISGLKGQLVHPTPLYSILWLFFIGWILLSLWIHHFSPPFIFGTYLILTGMGRFVEEAFRGEVQTPLWKGLHLYQWTALISVLIGIVMTMIITPSIEVMSGFGWPTFYAALSGGCFITFAMGIDFPYSNARFSRLV